MARSAKQGGTNRNEFIDVVDANGDPARVTLTSFENVWKDKGYKRAPKSETTEPKSS